MVAAGQRILASDFPGVQAWTPVISQGATNISKTVNAGSYVVNQNWLTGAMFVTMSASGTGSNAITIGLPVAPADAIAVEIGVGFLVDASSGITYGFHAYRSAAQEASLFRTADESTNPFLGLSGFTAALASGDQISFNVSYRVA